MKGIQNNLIGKVATKGINSLTPRIRYPHLPLEGNGCTQQRSQDVGILRSSRSGVHLGNPLELPKIDRIYAGFQSWRYPKMVG